MKEFFRKNHLMIIFAAIFAACLLFDRPRDMTAQAGASFRPDQFPILTNTEGEYAFIGYASWYSRKSPGVKATTANNEVFDDETMTCAIWGLPFDSKVRVTNLKNGKSVVLRVNDRGPHGRFFLKGRIIDLTHGAFRKISDPGEGLIEVKVEVINS